MTASAAVSLSVVVPVSGSEQHIGRCVGGLLGQDYPRARFEVVLVDNGSRDRSREIARRYPGVTAIHEPRPGPYAARNRGAEAASGETLAFTDSDCAARPDWLRRLAEALAEPRTGLVVGSAIPDESSRALRLLGAYEHAKDEFMRRPPDAAVHWGRAGSMAVRREVWEQCGPFAELRRGADNLLVRRVVEARSASAVRYEPRARVDHLELGSVEAYFRKLFVYARARGQLGDARTRTLTNAERIRVYRDAVRTHGLSAAEAGALLLMLAAGLCSWHAGSLTCRRPPRCASLSGDV